MIDDHTIEAEIQARGLTAPRVTPASIDAQIVAEAYHVFPGTTLTVCALTLRNGFIVTGESRPADDRNFDSELGQQIARRNARDKIWSLEGYALRTRLSACAPINPVVEDCRCPAGQICKTPACKRLRTGG